MSEQRRDPLLVSPHPTIHFADFTMTIDATGPPGHASGFQLQHSMGKQSVYTRCFQNYYHANPLLQPHCVYVAGAEPMYKHWQLRDMILCNDFLGSVRFAHGEGIYSTNLNSGSFETEEIRALTYRPLSIDTSPRGVVATGGLATRSMTNRIECDASSRIRSLTTPSVGIGDDRAQQGMFLILNPTLGIYESFRLGKMINNDVTIASDSTLLTAHVCNNDSSFYCVNVGTQDRINVTSRIQCSAGTCLNQSSRNPKHRNQVAVTSDGANVFIVDPLAGKVSHTIRSGHDLGFGVSHHSNGNVMAVLFQDGTCSLYDTRAMSHGQPLAEVKLSREGNQVGSFRACKFPLQNEYHDILIVLEHAGRVHVVDLRHLDPEDNAKHQVIVIPHALEQFGFSRAQGSGNGRTICPVSVYEEQESFTAPLVYDHEYVAKVNPRLFTGFQYIPPAPERARSRKPHSESTCITRSGSSGTSSRHQAFEPEEVGDILELAQIAYDEISWPSNEAIRYRHLSQLFSQTTGYDLVHGEMELCGIGFVGALYAYQEPRIVIGCNGGGLLLWDINGAGRRSSTHAEFV